MKKSIEEGCDLSEVKRLLSAAETKEMKSLLSHGVQPHLSTILHQACKSNKWQILDHLLAQGEDEMKNCSISDRGYSLLHEAVHYNKLDCLKLLVDKGADVEKMDNSGYTPLQLAVNSEEDKLSCVEYILSHVNEKVKASTLKYKTTNGRNSALHLAAMKGHDKTIQCLLKHGADVKGKNKDGNTCLHEAVLHKKHKAVQCILRHDKCELDLLLEIKNGKGETAQQSAMAGGSKEVIEAFEKIVSS